MRTMICRVVAVASLLVLVSVTVAGAAEQAETARLVQRIGPPPEPVKRDKLYVDAYYEPSDVMIGANTGHWIECTNTFGYFHDNIFGYAYISQLERLGNKDYTGNIGSYITLDKGSSIHFEIGFGWYVDYIYSIQTITEYSHRLWKDLFWRIGYNYRAYPGVGDTHLVYPGLIYYFGDHYISADWGVSFIESRDSAQLGTVKGDFTITPFLHLYGGVAFGQRLYDIYGMAANEEYGYILFSGITLIISKDVSVKFGGSYSEEEPKFIKRSINFAAAVKF